MKKPENKEKSIFEFSNFRNRFFCIFSYLGDPNSIRILSKTLHTNTTKQFPLIYLGNLVTMKKVVLSSTNSFFGTTVNWKPFSVCVMVRQLRRMVKKMIRLNQGLTSRNSAARRIGLRGERMPNAWVERSSGLRWQTGRMNVTATP